MLPTRPPADRLRQYALGELTPDEAAEVASWIESDPNAASDLSSLPPAHSDSDNGSSPPPLTARPRPTAVSPPHKSPQTDAAVCPVRIGGFRIVGQLGEGGMGVVYEAIDETLGRRAAVKVLSPAFASNPDYRQRFLREGKAVAAIRSDHVVTIYRAGEEDGLLFLAMEFLEGANLEAWLRSQDGPPDASVVLRVARDILTGLAAAHEQGILHRDIKPVNLWVESRTGRVKLLDFGLTREIEGDDTLTKPGAVLGTPAYMAPEQARGRRLDPRADLFSVGAVLHRMFAGQSPFARPNGPATLVAVATEDPPPLIGVPRALGQFIARLLAKDPFNRPDDANAALAELAAIKQSSTSRERGRTKGWLVAAGFALLVLLLVGVIIIIRDRTGKEIARIEIPDDAAKGGTAEIVDPKTGARSVIPLPTGAAVPPIPPAKDSPQPPIVSPKESAPGPRVVKEPPPPAPANPMRVRVKTEITGVTKLEGGEGRFVPVGSSGTVVATDSGRELYRVRFDDPSLDTLWLPTKVTEPLKTLP